MVNKLTESIMLELKEDTLYGDELDNWYKTYLDVVVNFKNNTTGNMEDYEIVELMNMMSSKLNLREVSKEDIDEELVERVNVCVEANDSRGIYHLLRDTLVEIVEERKDNSLKDLINSNLYTNKE